MEVEGEKRNYSFGRYDGNLTITSPKREKGDQRDIISSRIEMSKFSPLMSFSLLRDDQISWVLLDPSFENLSLSFWSTDKFLSFLRSFLSSIRMNINPTFLSLEGHSFLKSFKY